MGKQGVREKLELDDDLDPLIRLPRRKYIHHHHSLKTILIWGISCVLFVVVWWVAFVSWQENSTPETTVREQAFSYCSASHPTTHSHSPPFEHAQLVNVQILVRHGDRAPCCVFSDVPQNAWIPAQLPTNHAHAFTFSQDITDFPDKILTEEKVDCASGSLTTVGFEQHLELGNSIKQIYSHKLNLHPDNIYVRSTSLPRAQYSAAAFITGLLGSHSRQSTPIPIHVPAAGRYDALLIQTARCPRLQQLNALARNQNEWKHHVAGYGDLVSEVQAQGLPFEPSDGFECLFDNFHARVCHNIPLPSMKGSRISGGAVLAAFEAGEWEWAYRFWGPQQQRAEKVRLEMGPFVDVLFKNMWEAATNASDTQAQQSSLFVFVAHDNSIAATMSAFGMPQVPWPPYASNLIVELWKHPESSEPDAHYVRFVYNGKVVDMSKASTSPRPTSPTPATSTTPIATSRPPVCAGSLCSLALLRQYAQDHVIPSDYSAECLVRK